MGIGLLVTFITSLIIAICLREVGGKLVRDREVFKKELVLLEKQLMKDGLMLSKLLAVLTQEYNIFIFNFGSHCPKFEQERIFVSRFVASLSVLQRLVRGFN